MESSSSGSSKRAKGFENIRNLVLCLVDGCNSDLSQCREYHRRHKVCEFHSKTPKVTIGGREQRFCQQCSRFHSLVEFDDGKRSCRKRLDSHNRRRRKPPSESLSSSPGRFISNQQGCTTLLSFSNTTQQLLPSTMVGSSWAGPLKLENSNGGPFYCQDNNNNNNNNTFGVANEFKIIPGTGYSEPIFSKPVLYPGSDRTGYETTRVVDSDCALSLLSSATTAQTHGIGLGYSSQMPNIQYCEEPLSSSSYNNAHNNNFNCFNDGLGGPSAGGPSPTLSFKWE